MHVTKQAKEGEGVWLPHEPRLTNRSEADSELFMSLRRRRYRKGRGGERGREEGKDRVKEEERGEDKEGKGDADYQWHRSGRD